MTKQEFAGMVDLSCVQAFHVQDEIREMLELSRKYGFYSVIALPSYISYIRETLPTGCPVIIGAPVGFPDGGRTTEMKVRETREVIGLGSTEIDMMLNIGWVKDGRLKEVKTEIAEVVAAASGYPVKVILECFYLTDQEIRTACECAVDAGAAFIKTSTGWASGGATIEKLKTIAQALGGKCQIKAAGGIRDLKTILKMKTLGVTRFGLGTKTAERIILELPEN